MAGRSVSVTVVGGETIAAQLRQVPASVRPLFEEAAKFGREEMAKRAKPHAADKGTLAEAVTYELSGAGVALSARVGIIGRGHGMRSSLGGLAPTVNYGRRAGLAPPVRRIKAWLKSHGFHANPKAIQRLIADRGTQGVFFLEHTAEELGKKLPELIREHERRIEERWARKAA